MSKHFSFLLVHPLTYLWKVALIPSYFGMQFEMYKIQSSSRLHKRKMKVLLSTES